MIPEWKPIETAPTRKIVVIWANGPRFAVKDELGNWRNMLGGHINTKPKHWDDLPEKPR